jgi:hypothetical protein
VIDAMDLNLLHCMLRVSLLYVQVVAAMNLMVLSHCRASELVCSHVRMIDAVDLVAFTL